MSNKELEILNMTDTIYKLSCEEKEFQTDIINTINPCTISDTIERQGYNFLVDNSTVSIIEALELNLHTILYKALETLKLKRLLEDNSRLHDTPEQQQNKLNIRQHYNAYMGTL